MSTTPTTHHHLNGRKLRNLLRPNGRRVHIANTPEEHSRLRQSLAGIEPDDNFDIYLHGSPEHVSHERWSARARESLISQDRRRARNP